MQAAIERAIKTMWERYDEPLTLAELADSAILSRFYFSRVFRNVTGTSPGRFLTAIRLYKAKNLLLSTSLSVTELSYRVGYNSLGTFTTRFTKSVGVSPARYRYMAQDGIPRAATAPAPTVGRAGSIYGTLNLPPTTTPKRVYVGSFSGPVVEGPPASCDIVDCADSYRLPAVPDGQWCVRAAAVAVTNNDVQPWDRKPLFVSANLAAEVRQGGTVRLDIDMRPMSLIDLPILLALPELDSMHLPEQLAVG